jgi:hypothetical protein
MPRDRTTARKSEDGVFRDPGKGPKMTGCGVASMHAQLPRFEYGGVGFFRLGAPSIGQCHAQKH